MGTKLSTCCSAKGAMPPNQTRNIDETSISESPQSGSEGILRKLSGEAVRDNSEMQSVTDEGPLAINSKTMELLAHMEPIGVGITHAYGVDQYPILSSEASASVSHSDHAPFVASAFGKRTATLSASTPIDVIPDNKEVQKNTIELPVEEEKVVISDMEKNVTSIRVKQLSEILDPDTLRKTLEEQYAEEESEEENGEEGDDESEEMDPAELAEIKKRKSESINIQNKNNTLPLFEAQLYRDDSNAKWEKDDIEALRADMKQQLTAMKQETSKPQEKESHQPLSKVTKHKTYVIKVSGTTKDDDDNEATDNMDSSELEVSEDEEQEENPKLKDSPSDRTPLFRNQSAYKWDHDALKQTKEEMEKEMMHLIMNSSK